MNDRPKKKVEYTKEQVSLAVLKGDFRKELHPLTVCGSLVEHQPLYYDKNKLWWLWNKRLSKWEIIDETDLLNLIADALEWGGIINSRTKNEYLTALQMVARKNKPKEAPANWIQFSNKIVDIKTGEEFEPNSEYFFTNPLPWSYSPRAATPTIDKLFTDWVGAEHVQALYELVAYCLLRDYPIQRIFALVGSGSNGKGSFLRLLRKFLGINNVSSSELERLSKERFESVKLYKKLLCEIAETNVNTLRYTSFLKRASGGDLIAAQFKGKPLFDFVNYAKLVICTNSLPMTLDTTDGFYRRFNIIDFINKFPDGEEIINVIKDSEYANLARKSVAILKKLLERKGFINDGTIEFRKSRYEEKSNPIKTFINIFYQRDPEGYAIKYEFNDLFWQFSTDNGYRHLSANEINKALRSMGYEVKGKNVGDKTVKCVIGLTKVTEITSNPTLSSIYEKVNRDSGNLGNLGNPKEFSARKTKKHEQQELDIIKCTGAEHFGKCSQCERDDVWLDHALSEGFGTSEEKFICEDCAGAPNDNKEGSS